jgi:hypothetical protein
MKGYNYTSLANDGALPLSGQYGIPYSFQAGRQIRFRIRFSF